MTASGIPVAIGSLGSIGARVAKGIVAEISGFNLVAASARDMAAAKAKLEAIGSDARLVPLDRLAEDADIVIECAPVAVFRDIAVPAIEAGRTFVPASVAGLLFNPDLIARAAETGARIIVPTGAIAGLDAVRAAAKGRIDSAALITRKPPKSLSGAPGLAGMDYDPDSLTEPLRVFEGDTLEAARAFPANVNVAAALALAGIGPESTRVEIWADPAAVRNTHTIRIESDAMRLDLAIEALPSVENPKSSTLTPLSILAALESLVTPVRVGS
ncbi:MAG: aspartate dehydrogenase [Rhodobiaceae bacterium]|nr:aspartate dehydrogenase [Rhodobiaceae bacterium]